MSGAIFGHNRSKTLVSVCVLTKFSQNFLTFDTQKLAHTTNWHTQFRFWYVVGLVKEENAMSTDTLEIEMTRTTRHVTLRWHCRMKVIFFWKRHVTLCIWSWMSNESCQTCTLILVWPSRTSYRLWSFGFPLVNWCTFHRVPLRWSIISRSLEPQPVISWTKLVHM